MYLTIFVAVGIVIVDFTLLSGRMGEFGNASYEKIDYVDPIEVLNIQGTFPAGIELQLDKKQQKLVFVDLGDPSKKGADIPMLGTIDIKKFPET